jgi:hypothetical protein
MQAYVQGVRGTSIRSIHQQFSNAWRRRARGRCISAGRYTQWSDAPDAVALRVAACSYVKTFRRDTLARMR